MNNLTHTLFTLTVLATFKANNILVGEGDKLSNEFSLTSARWRVMAVIVTAKRALSVSEIAKKMAQSRQGVLRLINEMDTMGLLEKQPNPKHKRSIIFNLSNKGLLIYYQLEQKQRLWAKQIDGKINTCDLQTTVSTLNKISNIFN